MFRYFIGIALQYKQTYRNMRVRLALGSCLDTAFDQTNYAVGLFGDPSIVRHHDYSELLPPVQLTQHRHDLLTSAPVEISGWFRRLAALSAPATRPGQLPPAAFRHPTIHGVCAWLAR